MGVRLSRQNTFRLPAPPATRVRDQHGAHAVSSFPPIHNISGIAAVPERAGMCHVPSKRSKTANPI